MMVLFVSANVLQLKIRPAAKHLGLKGNEISNASAFVTL